MSNDELEAYKRKLKQNLKHVAPIFAKATVGDFSKDVKIPAHENELTVFLVGVQIMLDAIREKERESKIAVSRLNAANSELEHEKAVYHAVLNSVAEGLVVVDKDARITLMNQAAGDLLGIDRKQAIGCYYYDIVVTRDREGRVVPVSKRPLHKALVTGSKQIESLARGLHYVRSDGTNLPVAITASAVKLGKNVIGGVSTFRDISAEKQLDRTKSEIISIASHQLRTPLTAIKWLSEQLVAPMRSMTQAKQKRYASNIHASNERMIALVNDLLNVSRLELGTIKLEPRPFDLVATINGIVKDLEAEVRTRDITIEQKFGPGLELVVSDPWHVQVITQNLLSNAVKYSPPGQHVTITAKRQADELVLTVKDHGYGIPRRQQSKVFTKLFRADNARKAVSDGSGLGLYVCKAMVEQLGGKIWFESTEGKGSTFHVSLPWLDVIDDSVKLA